MEKQASQKKNRKYLMNRGEKMRKVEKKLQEREEEIDMRKIKGRKEKLEKIER